jgi:hypothetical protein
MFSHLIPVHLLTLIITICGDVNCEMNVRIASQGTVFIEHDLYVTFEGGGGVSTMLR